MSSFEQTVARVARGDGSQTLGPITIQAAPMRFVVRDTWFGWMTDDAKAEEEGHWGVFFKRIIEVVDVLGGECAWPGVGTFRARRWAKTNMTGKLNRYASLEATLEAGLSLQSPSGPWGAVDGVDCKVEDGVLVEVWVRQPIQADTLRACLTDPVSRTLRKLDLREQQRGVTPEELIAAGAWPALARLGWCGALSAADIGAIEVAAPALTTLWLRRTNVFTLRRGLDFAEDGAVDPPWPRPEYDAAALKSAGRTSIQPEGSLMSRFHYVSDKGNAAWETNNWWEIELVGTTLVERWGHLESSWGVTRSLTLPNRNAARRLMNGKIAEKTRVYGYRKAASEVGDARPQPASGWARVRADRDLRTPSTHHEVWTQQATRARLAAAAPVAARALEVLASADPPRELDVQTAAVILLMVSTTASATWLADAMGPAFLVHAAAAASHYSFGNPAHGDMAWLSTTVLTYDHPELWAAVRDALTGLDDAARNDAHAAAEEIRGRRNPHLRAFLSFAFDDAEQAQADLATCIDNEAHLPLFGVVRDPASIRELMRKPVTRGASGAVSGIRQNDETEPSIIRAIGHYLPSLLQRVDDAEADDILHACQWGLRSPMRLPTDLPDLPKPKLELTETPVEERVSRLAILSPSVFRNVEPEDTWELYQRWMTEADRVIRAVLKAHGHAKLATSHRRAFRKDAEARAWEVGLWKWSQKAVQAGLDPVSDAVVREYANVVRDVIRGYHDGDFGTDFGIGFVALAEWLPFATACVDLDDLDSAAWSTTVAARLEQEVGRLETF